jgi:hypothetical protein
MELLLWLEQIEIWRLQREQAPVKQEDPGASPDKTTFVSYSLITAPAIKEIGSNP